MARYTGWVTTITVELEDDVAARLEADAERAGMAADKLLAAIARDHFQEAGLSEGAAEIIDRQFERYRGVFQRLSE